MEWIESMNECIFFFLVPSSVFAFCGYFFFLHSSQIISQFFSFFFFLFFFLFLLWMWTERKHPWVRKWSMIRHCLEPLKRNAPSVEGWKLCIFRPPPKRWTCNSFAVMKIVNTCGWRRIDDGMTMMMEWWGRNDHRYLFHYFFPPLFFSVLSLFHFPPPQFCFYNILLFRYFFSIFFVSIGWMMWCVWRTCVVFINLFRVLWFFFLVFLLLLSLNKERKTKKKSFIKQKH